MSHDNGSIRFVLIREITAAPTSHKHNFTNHSANMKKKNECIVASSYDGIWDVSKKEFAIQNSVLMLLDDEVLCCCFDNNNE
jgi:hypothetical protein